jgi:hypothetical protein
MERPSPLTIGTRFVKQYYQTLSTTPDQINRFYQPSSILSVGMASEPTQPALFEAVGDKLTDRFQQGTCLIRFDFDKGAIDAQESVSGGILLVVTGHVVYLKDENDEEGKRKAFVHTFFLGSSLGANNKRTFYVHNDVLRFLHDDAEEEQTAEEEEEVHDAPPVTEEPPEIKHMITPLPRSRAGPLTGDEAPGGGVEETKEALLEDDEEEVVAAPDGAVMEEPEPIPVSKEPVAEEAAATLKHKTDNGGKVTPKAPGSWASLVARSGSSPASTPTTPGTPVRPTAAPPKSKSPPPVEKVEPVTDGAPVGVRPFPSIHRGPKQRDPDCTLVIKNLSGEAVEPEVRGLFEPFAAKTNSVIVGCYVAAHRNLAFVDFDQTAPVLLALEQHQTSALTLHDRKLEIHQKTVEQRGRSGGGGGGGRGSGRSGSRGGGQPGGGGSMYRWGSVRDSRRGSRGERGTGTGGRGGGR